MGRAKELLLSAFKAPLTRMGAHQSKPHDEAQLEQYDDCHLASTSVPCKPRLATTVFPLSPCDTPSSVFPSELPPRPQKQSRLSFSRKKKSAANPSSLAGAPSFPVSPPLSPIDSDSITLNLRSEIPSHVDYNHDTPPTSPSSPAVDRQTGYFSKASHSLKTAASSPSLSSSLFGKAFARREVAHREPLSPEKLPLSSAPSSRSDDSISDPLVARFARLRLSHFPPPASGSTADSNRLSTQEQNPTRSHNAHAEGLQHRSDCIEEHPDMGPARQIRRRARESSQPYQTASKGRSIKQPTADGSEPDLDVEQDNVSYPDIELIAALAESRSRTLSPELPAESNVISRRAAAIQEEEDRRLAEMLQDAYDEREDAWEELEDVYDEPEVTSLGGRQSPTLSQLRDPAGSSPSPSPFRETSRFIANDTHVATKPHVNRGTRDDPIELDSDSDSDSNESYEQAVEDWDRYLDEAAFHGEPMVLDDSSSDDESDTEFARRLHEEEEQRLRHESETWMRDAEVARRLHEEEEERIRHEPQTRTRDCAVCGDATPIIDLPSLSSCAHKPETCAGCYAGWIASELGEKGWRNIKCPGGECRVILAHHEVQQYATKEVFEQYDTFAMREALADDPSFRW